MNLPKLIPNWKAVLKRSWAIWLTAAATTLSGVEVGLALVNPDAFGIPRGTFAAMAGLVSAAAYFARIVAQKDLTK